MIRAENVVKTFQRGATPVEVLRGVNLDIEAGERVAVVGVSGVGKSTLLHIIGALERPTSGRVRVGDTDITDADEDYLASFRNKRLGFVFQFHYLLPEFTAVENTMLPAMIGGVSEADARKQAAELLDRLGLGRRLSHRPSELSGGEQQRVALGRALMHRPPVLLADEPTGNLDTRTGEEIHKLLVEINEEFGTTMLIVTHSPQLAARMHRSLTLVEGRIEEVAPGEMPA